MDIQKKKQMEKRDAFKTLPRLLRYPSHPSYLQCSDEGCGFLKPQQMQRTIYFIELGAARSSVDVVTFQI